MGQNNTRRRAGDFRERIEAMLGTASGKCVGSVHDGRVTTVHLGLRSNSGPKARPPDAFCPFYGPEGLLASLRAAMQGLVADSNLRFGEVAVSFANGLVAHMLVTARFLPGEEDEMDSFLGRGASPRRPRIRKEAAY